MLVPVAAGAQIREGEPVLLEPSVVVADQPLVKTVGDTVVFSPSALNVEDDAMLEDILQKIPGIEIDSGNVTLYGRRIEKMLVGGIAGAVVAFGFWFLSALAPEFRHKKDDDSKADAEGKGAAKA